MAYDQSSFMAEQQQHQTVARSNLEALKSLNTELYLVRQLGDVAGALMNSAMPMPMQVDVPVSPHSHQQHLYPFTHQHRPEHHYYDGFGEQQPQQHGFGTPFEQQHDFGTHLEHQTPQHASLSVPLDLDQQQTLDPRQPQHILADQPQQHTIVDHQQQHTSLSTQMEQQHTGYPCDKCQKMTRGTAVVGGGEDDAFCRCNSSVIESIRQPDHQPDQPLLVTQPPLVLAESASAQSTASKPKRKRIADEDETEAAETHTQRPSALKKVKLEGNTARSDHESDDFLLPVKNDNGSNTKQPAKEDAKKTTAQLKAAEIQAASQSAKPLFSTKPQSKKSSLAGTTTASKPLLPLKTVGGTAKKPIGAAEASKKLDKKIADPAKSGGASGNARAPSPAKKFADFAKSGGASGNPRAPSPAKNSAAETVKSATKTNIVKKQQTAKTDNIKNKPQPRSNAAQSTNTKKPATNTMSTQKQRAHSPAQQHKTNASNDEVFDAAYAGLQKFLRGNVEARQLNELASLIRNKRESLSRQKFESFRQGQWVTAKKRGGGFLFGVVDSRGSAKKMVPVCWCVNGRMIGRRFVHPDILSACKKPTDLETTSTADAELENDMECSASDDAED